MDGSKVHIKTNTNEPLIDKHGITDGGFVPNFYQRTVHKVIATFTNRGLKVFLCCGLVWYDKRLHKKEFKEGDKVLLYNSRYKVFGKGKLQSKWDGPYVVHSVSPSGVVTIMDAKGDQCVVNGQ
jgi:hypothetical protein